MAGANGLKSRVIRWMETNRALIIFFFVLPMSFLFDLAMSARKWFYRSFLSAPHKHDERVKAIQRRVRTWSDLPASRRRYLCTSRPNWLSLSTTFVDKSACHQIPVNLYDILSVDEVRRVVRVEPGVSVGEITRYLIPRGYTLAVTLEIADATLGGLAMGVGMTTYSHKVGLYQETVVSYDMVMPDASLIHVTSDNEHKDLFYALPWSHGTLGFLVALELQIIPVKPYVRLNYEPINGLREYCDRIRELSGANEAKEDVPDYLEVTVFSKDKAVIMSGTFSDVEGEGEEKKVNPCSRWYKPWFYKHVETFLARGPTYEYIPLCDYLLRHNRAIFWVVESMMPGGNHPVFRYLFGWLLPPKPAFLKFTTTPGIRAMTFCKQVFQDITLPINKLEEQIDISERLFDTYPILIYPCRIYKHSEGPQGQLRCPRPDQMVPGTNYAMFNDLGVYGVPAPVRRKERYDAVSKMREIEEFTMNVGGYPFLYADIFMSREEFEKMFDLRLYNRVREKYKLVHAFPTLYDKVKPEIDVFKVGQEYIDPL